MRRLTALLLAAVAVATAVAAPVPAWAEDRCATPAGVYRDGTPWAQELLAPQRVWPLTTGAGQTVAVVGTGVDPGNAQLAGRVSGSETFGQVDKTHPDCNGRGTVAAGMIAAVPRGSTTFSGLAPGASILSLHYTDAADGDAGGSGGAPSADQLAAAIDSARQHHADVVCVAVPTTEDSGQLRKAVAAAVAAGIVVVSPALIGQNGGAAARSYPTSLPGVLGVASVDRNGSAVSGETGDYLDVSAPGADVVGTAAGAGGHVGHNWPVNDPAAAAGYAAATVALVRAYRPELTTAAAVVDRIEATADRGTQSHDPRVGHGLIDPYAAVTAELPTHRGTPRPKTRTVQAAAVTTPHLDPHRTPVVVIGLGAVAGAIVATLLVAATRRARANGFRPRR
ncbi:S8 family serine peptidase [Actinocatenispora rupis]|uniref:Peptidase S8 n=1 Tax=Actinocatenispora rupis TaxID=519421 RepID=A0A8J3NGE9_9ACTN|nr:S8 family serine peptidase [Actinocatenispora rupis]GID15860.1 peptidase S8 [Actinocatenispora rupis]